MLLVVCCISINCDYILFVIWFVLLFVVWVFTLLCYIVVIFVMWFVILFDVLLPFFSSPSRQ